MATRANTRRSTVNRPRQRHRRSTHCLHPRTVARHRHQHRQAWTLCLPRRRPSRRRPSQTVFLQRRRSPSNLWLLRRTTQKSQVSRQGPRPRRLTQVSASHPTLPRHRQRAATLPRPPEKPRAITTRPIHSLPAQSCQGRIPRAAGINAVLRTMRRRPSTWPMRRRSQMREHPGQLRGALAVGAPSPTFIAARSMNELAPPLLHR